jgi:hypothetical protein
MKLDVIILSEISQTQNEKSHMFSLICRILGRTHEIKMGTISDLEGIKG